MKRVRDVQEAQQVGRGGDYIMTRVPGGVGLGSTPGQKPEWAVMTADERIHATVEWTTHSRIERATDRRHPNARAL